MIELNNVSKYFGKNCAVKNLNLVIERGDLFGLLGPNGAGKSTTLAMICGLIKISSGFITINGKNLTENINSNTTSIGVLFENPTFYEYLSGRSNLSLLSKLKGCSAKQNVDYLLDLVSLTDKADEKVKKYSFGMKQRLALASALIGNPEILLLDEPTNGLDPEGVHKTLSILKTLSSEKKKTIIISSHQVHDIESLCNKIAILHKGALLSSGSLDKLLQEKFESFMITTNNPEECRKYLCDKPWVQDFKSITNKKNLKQFYLETINKA